MPSLRHRLLLVPLALLAAVWNLTLTPVATAAPAGATEEAGYIEMTDGVGLRYTVFLPEGDGPFPVLLQYSGYGAGSNPYDNAAR